MSEIDFGVYRTHDELYAVMKQLAEAYPSFSELYSIGKSLQGRDLWIMEITNKESGPAEEDRGAGPCSAQPQVSGPAPRHRRQSAAARSRSAPHPESEPNPLRERGPGPPRLPGSLRRLPIPLSARRKPARGPSAATAEAPRSGLAH